MAELRSKPYSPVRRRGRAARSNASIAPSYCGGAPAVHTAVSSDSVLSGPQSSLSMIQSVGGETSKAFPSSSGYPCADYTGGFFVPFVHGDILQANLQFSLSTSASIPCRYLDVDNTTVEIPNTANHHPSGREPEAQSAAPWSHLSATEGGQTQFLPLSIGTGKSERLQYLTTPPRRRANSSASGGESFRDSAYWTGSRESQHEAESLADPCTEEPMGPNNQNQAFVYLNSQQMGPLHSSPPSTTITQGGVNNPPRTSKRGQATGPKNKTFLKQTSAAILCPKCGVASKTPSELRKHQARHDRKFKCSYPECLGPARVGCFATRNDLDRHLKSRHRVNNRNTKFYRCRAEGCSKATMNWPRLDNFQQHLIKIHHVEDTAVYLRLSDEWYRQNQQQPREESYNNTQLHDISNDMAIAAPLIPIAESMGACPSIYPDPNMSYNLQVSVDNSMVSNYNVGHQDLDLNLSSTRSVDLQTAPGVQARRVPSSSSVSGVQRRFFPANYSLGSFAALGVPMQRTRSQADMFEFDNEPQFSQIPNSLVGFVSDISYTDFAQPVTGMRMSHPVKYSVHNKEILKVKGPHTVAHPFLDPNRMEEVPPPQEAQAAMLEDLRDQQEHFLVNTGVAAESVAPIPPHQGFHVNIFPPGPEMETSATSASELSRLVQNEIQSFLDKHLSRADDNSQAPSTEEILTRFRSSLQSFDSAMPDGSSPMSHASGNRAPELLEAKKCPHTQKTYYPCPFEGCSKVKIQRGLLKKHMRRHEKVFGCTDDDCHSSFGSKHDWKRHEQKQHQQEECWRCPVCDALICHDQVNYIRHMSEVHSMHRLEGTPNNAEHRRIARNYQGCFWCGFCNEIVVHGLLGEDAIKLRFDHVADHFTKDEKNIKDWVELRGKGKVKGLPQGPGSGQLEKEDDSMAENEAESESAPSVISLHSESPEEHTFSPYSPSLMASSSGLQQERADVVFSLDQPTGSHMQTGDAMMFAMGRAFQGNEAMPTVAATQNDQGQSQRRRHRVAAKCAVCCECQTAANLVLGKTCNCCFHPFCQNCHYDAPTLHE